MMPVYGLSSRMIEYQLTSKSTLCFSLACELLSLHIFLLEMDVSIAESKGTNAPIAIEPL